MAIKFQYNKTSLQQLEKQLKVRVRTLPIIKNKESALRMEVKRCKSEAAALDEKLEREIQAYEAMFALWNEFDSSLIKVSDVHLGVKRLLVYGCRCSKTLISKYAPTACSMLPMVCRRHTFAQGVGTDGYRAGVYRRQTGLAGTCA